MSSAALPGQPCLGEGEATEAESIRGFLRLAVREELGEVGRDLRELLRKELQAVRSCIQAAQSWPAQQAADGGYTRPTASPPVGGGGGFHSFTPLRTYAATALEGALEEDDEGALEALLDADLRDALVAKRLLADRRKPQLTKGKTEPIYVPRPGDGPDAAPKALESAHESPPIPRQAPPIPGQVDSSIVGLPPGEAEAGVARLGNSETASTSGLERAANPGLGRSAVPSHAWSAQRPGSPGEPPPALDADNDISPRCDRRFSTKSQMKSAEPGSPTWTSSRSQRTTAQRTTSQRRGWREHLWMALGMEPSSRMAEAASGRTEMKPELERPRFKRLELFVRGETFEAITTSMILINALYVGVQTDYMARERLATRTDNYRFADLVFCCYFIAEICLKLFVHRFRFFTMWGWGWNTFDLFLVVIQVAEEAVMYTNKNESGTSSWPSAIVLRAVRVIRLGRSFRVLRAMRATKELRLLVTCVISSVSAFCWSLVLILLMIYIMAILITQIVLNHSLEDVSPDSTLTMWWGSVPRSMLSLFQGLTGGVDWYDISEPLISEISPVLGFFFFIYTAFMILAVMNVVTSMFVQNAQERAVQVKEMQRLTYAKTLFQNLDSDRSGFITLEEIDANLDSSSVNAFFNSIDVAPSEALSLFQMLDQDQSGRISLEEFLTGCMRLQAPAKTVDLVLASNDMRKSCEHMVHHVSALQRHPEAEAGQREPPH